MSPSPESNRRQKLGGLLTRRERWGLSWQGWTLVLALGLFAGAAFVLGICPFLSVTERVRTDVLVMEGWLPENLIHQAAAEFTSGNYKQLLTTGGGWSHAGDIDPTHTWASVGASRLRAAGVPETALCAVPCRFTERDRTYVSALAIGDWLDRQHIHVQGINVLTEGLHARRTRLLFQNALGKDVSVGVVALSSQHGHWTRWWQYSDTVREVIEETVGYLYAKVVPFRYRNYRARVRDSCDKTTGGGNDNTATGVSGT